MHCDLPFPENVLNQNKIRKNFLRLEGLLFMLRTVIISSTDFTRTHETLECIVINSFYKMSQKAHEILNALCSKLCL